MISATDHSNVKHVEINVEAGAVVTNTSNFTIVQNENEKPPLKIRYRVRDPVESFCGRVDFLDKLHSAIQSQQDDEGTEKLTVLSQMKVISGLGGVGKTETARKYIVQYAQYYDNFIWINAESEESLTQSFLQLAVEKLDINIYQTGTGAENGQQKQRLFNDISEEVYNKLCVQDTLIIFDNADGKRSRSIPSVQQNRGKRSTRKMARSMAELHSFLPTSILPPLKRPFVLVTSRNQDFGGLGLKKHQIVALDVFTDEESCQFIIGEINLDGALEKNQEDALALGKLLGHLPLALQQAVAYIREEIENTKYGPTPFTIHDYIKLYQAEGQRRDLLDFESDTDYEWTLYTTWKITLKKIKEQGPVEGPLAVDIIKAMSFLYADNIPNALILGIFENKDRHVVDINKGLGLLEKYSMIKHHLENSNDDTNTNFLSIHRQVQHVTLERLKEKEELSKFLDRILLEPCQLFVENLPMSTSIYRTVLENLYSICEISSQILDQGTEKDPGDHHQRLLNFQEIVAEKFDAVGNVNRAFSLFRELVARHSKSDGLSTENEVSFRNWSLQQKLATVLLKKGEIGEALKLLRSVKALFESLIPTRRLQVQNLAHNFSPQVLETFFASIPKIFQAFDLVEQGKKLEALDLITEILDPINTILKQEHPDTLPPKDAQANALLYFMCLSCERFAEAATIFKNVEEAQKILDSIDIFGMLKSFQSLVISRRIVQTEIVIAKALLFDEKFEEALHLFREIHDNEMPALGFTPSEISSIQISIAATLGMLGRHEEAAKVRRQFETEIGHQRTSPSEAHQTGHHVGSLLVGEITQAVSLLEQGQGHQGLEMINQILPIIVSNHGKDHPMTLHIKAFKAQALGMLGRNDEALALFQEIYEAQKALFGEEDHVTLDSFGNLLICQMEQRKIIRTQEKVKGHDLEDETCAASLRHIWESQRAKLGPDHAMTMRAANHLVRALTNIGQNEEALKILAQQDDDSSTSLQTSSTEGLGAQKVRILANRAAFLMDLGQVEQAVSTNEKAYKTHLELGGKNSVVATHLLFNMACMKHRLGKVDEAIQHCEEVVKVHRPFLGPGHPDVVKAENFWIKLLLEQERYDQALVTTREVYTRRKIVLGPEDPQVQKLERDLETTALQKKLKDLQNTVIFSQLAEQSLQSGEYSQALDYYEMVFEIQRKTLGIGHWDVIATRHSMACCLCHLGLFSEAVKMSKDVKETMEAVLGRSHSIFRVTLENLGTILEMADAPLDDRVKIQRDLVQVDRMVLGGNHSDTLESMEKLADLLVEKEDFQEALDLYERVRNIQQGNFQYDKKLQQKILDIFLIVEAISLSAS